MILIKSDTVRSMLMEKRSATENANINVIKKAGHNGKQNAIKIATKKAVHNARKVATHI